jgi:SAM-dependent methyltransferase
MDFGLVTNGRMLAYPELVDRLAALRLKYVYMSLHGGTAKIHNAMVRAHAFTETFEAVKVLSGRGLDLTVNTVVTTVNVEHLIPIVDLLLPFDDVVLKFSMVEPKGAADLLFDNIMPKVEHVASRVFEAITYGMERSTGLRFSHGGIPFCLLPELEHQYDDLRTHGFASMTEVYEPDFYPVDDENKEHTEKCFDCKLRGACPGLFKGYNAAFGDDVLKPVFGLRSNSFNYVLEREFDWKQGDPCPILSEGALPYDRGRHLFVRDGERMLQHRTTTRDFSDAELDHIKRDLGQIYLDLSDKDAPNDFGTDLKKLARVSDCDDCPLQDNCAWCFEAVDVNVFRQNDLELRQMLSGLQGDVLDIGCGESRYGDLLESLHKSEQIRYTGVEPDEAAVNAFRAAHPWADIVHSDIETLELAPESYDHILVLRSYNHIRNLRVVFESLSAALRPGGALIVADNVAFGLVRSKTQAGRGESSVAAFEHYRNHSGLEAAELISSTGFELRSEQKVSATSSNQWLLHYQKPEAAAAIGQCP